MLSGASGELELYFEKQELLRQELRKLEDGTLAAGLKEQQAGLEQELEKLNAVMEQITKEQIGREGDCRAIRKDLEGFQEKLRILEEGFVVNEALLAEVRENLEKQAENTYRRKQNERLSELAGQEEQAADQRVIARNKFNRDYPAYGFTGVERENDVYDKVLEELKRDFEPKYKEEFEKQYQQVYYLSLIHI